MSGRLRRGPGGMDLWIRKVSAQAVRLCILYLAVLAMDPLPPCQGSFLRLRWDHVNSSGLLRAYLMFTLAVQELTA